MLLSRYASMKHILFAFVLIIPSMATAFELTMMLGEIEQVVIESRKPKDEPGFLDHSCGHETVTFRVQEYLSGKGKKTVALSRALASYNCQSSWRGVPPSPVIAMRSDWDTYSIYRGIVILTQTDGGLFIIDDIDRFLNTANIHLKGKETKLIQPLKNNVERIWSVDQGPDTLNYLSDLGVLKYEPIEVDLNENCISGCEEGNIIKAYKVTYLKGISIESLRNYNLVTRD